MCDNHLMTRFFDDTSERRDDESVHASIRLAEAMLGVELAWRECEAMEKKWEALLGRPFEEHCRELARSFERESQ